MKHLLLIHLLVFTQVMSQTFPWKIGMGLAGFGDNSANEMASLMPNVKYVDYTSLDANGYPNSNFNINFDWRPFGQYSPSYIPDDPNPHVLPSIYGAYVLSFNGSASINVPTWACQATISGPIYNSTTNVSLCTITLINLNRSNEYAYTFFRLEFSNTKKTSNSASNTGISNLQIVRPGGNLASPFEFNPSFLNALSPFAPYRFMDWLHTNNSDNGYPTVRNWSDRQLPSRFPWSKGVPWEYIAGLANLTGRDIWINIPVDASDDYVTNLAHFLKSNLRNDINVYVEYSNEVWNGGFTQYDYNLDAVLNSPEDADIRASTTFNDRRVARRVAKKVIQHSQVIASVLGVTLASRSRVRPVFAYQIGGWLEWYRDALNYVNSAFGTPSNFLYAIASAPYFGDASIVDGDSPAQVVDKMRTQSNANVANIRFLSTLAGSFGLLHLQYEGGPDNGGGSTVALSSRISANRLASMGKLVYDNYASNFFASTVTSPFPISVNGFANYFVTNGGVSRHGCWGASEDLSRLDHAQYSVKYQGLCSLTGLCGSIAGLSISAGSVLDVYSTTTIGVLTTIVGASIAKVELYDGMNLVATDNTAPYTVAYAPTIAGMHTLMAKLIDNLGRFKFSNPTQIQVVNALNVSTVSVNFTTMAGVHVLTVSGNQNWNVAKGVSWIQLSTTSGLEGIVPFSVSVTGNSALNRSSVITLSGGGFYRYIQINQAGIVPSLSVVPGTVTTSSLTTVLGVSISSNHAWSVAGSNAWVALSTNAGTNNQWIYLTIQPNMLLTSRNANLTVSGLGLTRLVSVIQNGAPPVLNIYPTVTSALNYSGASLVVTINSNLNWTLTGFQSWVQPGTTTGTGNAQLVWNIVSNPNATSRQSTITLVGTSGMLETITIHQQAAPPILTVNPANIIGASAAADSYSLSITSNVNWTVNGLSTWQQMSSLSGVGTGVSILTVLSNVSVNSRSNAITLSGAGIQRVLSISQLGASPLLTISSASIAYNQIGGANMISITSNISWSITGVAPWLSLTTLAGTDNRVVQVNASTNASSSPRTATLSVSGGGILRTLIISQLGTAPSITVDPTFVNINYPQSTTNLSINSNIAWTISGLGSWLNASTLTGSQNFNVVLTAQANSSIASRSATISVSGMGITQVVSINQQGAIPILTISPASISNISFTGTTVGLSINTNHGWTILGLPAWVTVGSISGFGNASCSLTIQNNIDPVSRSVIITVLGSTGLKSMLNVAQSPGPAQLLLNPMSLVGISATLGFSSITISSNIAWTLLGLPNWINATTTTGYGSKVVNLTFSANNSITGRNSTLTLSGMGLYRFLQIAQNGSSPYIDVSPSALAAEYKQSSFPLSITSNVVWNIIGVQDWISSNVYTGTSSIITLTVNQNLSEQPRQQVLTLAGGGITKKINISQSGFSPFIMATPSVLEVASSPSSPIITVASNITWQVSMALDWVTVSKSTGSDQELLTLQISENSLPQIRQGTLSITGHGLTSIITIQQSPKKSDEDPLGGGVFLERDSIFVSDIDSVYIVKFKHTSKVNVYENVTWFDIQSKNDSSVSILVYQNLSFTSRIGELEFSDGKSTKYLKVIQEGRRLTNNSEIHSKPSVFVWPNPASDQVYFQHSFHLPVRYELVDVYGKMALEGFISNRIHTVPISDVPAGVWILKFYLFGNLLESSKLIICH